MHDPTTLPETGSVNKFSHNYSVFQTRLLQKIGKLEKSLEYTPEFRTLNDRAKDFVICYEEVLRVARRFLATHKVIADAQVQHADVLHRFATDIQKDHEALSNELRRIGENTKQLAHVRITWEKEGNDAFVAQLEKFMREVSLARKAKDDFRESRIALDTVETKLRSLQSQKSPDISALYLQQRFENCWTDSFTKLSDVDTKRDLDLLLLFIGFIEAQQRHWAAMLEVVGELESVANNALQQAYTFRSNDEARREKRALDKAAAISLADSTKWNTLMSLLSNKDLALFSAICGASDKDETIEVIVKVLEQQTIIFPIVSDQIQREVTKTDSIAILFRGNTIGTKIMMSYVRYSGKQYMQSTLGPLLQEIIELGDAIEVDPNKMHKGQDLVENMARYKRVCKRCFDAIIASLPNAPRSFREVARFLNNEVNKKFPNSKFQGVAGMVFLRFFCPGFSAPDSYGLLDSKQLQPDNRRALILVSKVLQNTANNIIFSQKEPYMQEMNQWVEDNIPLVNKFFAEFIDLESKPSATQPLFDPNTSPDCQEIYRFILAHLDPIGKGLVSSNHEAMVPVLAEALAQIWAHTHEAEAPLGPAFRRSALSAGRSSVGRVNASDRSSLPGANSFSSSTSFSPSVTPSSSLSTSGGATSPPQRETMLGAARTLPTQPAGEQRATLTSSMPNQPSRGSPPRNPSPRPLPASPFAKPTAPPSTDSRGFVRPVSPVPRHHISQQSPSPSPSPPHTPEAHTPPTSHAVPHTAASVSLATLLPSPAAPPSPPDPSAPAVSPRGPVAPETLSPGKMRPEFRSASPSPRGPAPAVPLRQPSPSPHAISPRGLSVGARDAPRTISPMRPVSPMRPASPMRTASQQRQTQPQPQGDS